MKDSYSFDVDDAGLERSLRRRTAQAYIKIFDRLGLDYVIVSGDVRRDGRQPQRGVPAAHRGRRGHLRPLHELRLRRERRGRGHPRAARAATGTTRPPRTSRTPRHARPSTPWSPSPTSGSPAHDRPGRPPTRSRTSSSPWSTPTAPASRWSIGVPGDREVDLKRLEAAVPPAEVEPFTRPTSTSTPRSSRATSGPACSARRPSRASATSLDPRVVARHRAGSPAPNEPGRHVLRPRRRPRLHRRTAPSRRPRSATATPARSAAARSRPPAASRSATSSSSAASTPRRSA